MGWLGKTSLRTRVNRAGSSSKKGTQLAARRTKFHSLLMAAGNLAASGSKNHAATRMSQAG
jgi:hypothetical protein